MARWVLSGRLRVREELTTNARQTRNLEGVRVVISATRTGGKWKKWGEDRTDNQGKFRLVVDKSGARRRFKIKIFLEDQFLRVMRPRFLRVGKDQGEEQSAPIEVFRDQSRRTGQDVSFGTITLDDNADRNVARRHGRRAAIWYVAKTVQNKLLDRDEWLGYNRQLTVVYPSLVFTSGMDNRVRIASDNYPDRPSYNLRDLVHEMMHIWNYQHNQGTSQWVRAWLVWLNTHNRQERPNIAFHEGFAEWASCALRHYLWGHRLRLPANRFWVASNNRGPEVENMAEFERNDNCVISSLLLLLHPYPWKFRFGTSTSSSNGDEREVAVDEGLTIPTDCPVQRLDFWDILLAFRGGQHENWPTDWEVGDRDFGLLRFFDRLSDIYPDKFPEESKDIYLRVLDPEGTEELSDYCH